ITPHSTPDSGVSSYGPKDIPFRNRDGRPALVYHNNFMCENLEMCDVDLATLEKDLYLLVLETTGRTFTFSTKSADIVRKWYKGLNKLFDIEVELNTCIWNL
ncbi:unnamed protein product, partial [Owenia fusiformis]